MKGIVLEVKEDEAIVLTKDGAFQAIKRNRGDTYVVGDEVEIPELYEEIKKVPWFRYPAVIALASCFVILLVVLGAFMFWPDHTPVAYVQLDFNPSVELSVNRSMEVLSLTGLNPEGEQVVQYMKDWWKHSLHNVIVNMLITAQDQGYLGEMNGVLVTTSMVDGYALEKYDPLITEALQKAEKKLQESESMYVYGTSPDQKYPEQPATDHVVVFYRLNAPPGWRDQAQAAGVSLGKYMLLKYAEEKGIEILPEEIDKLSIMELIRKLGGLEPLLDQPVTPY